MSHKRSERSQILVQTIAQDLGPLLDVGYHGAAWHEGKADIHVMTDQQDVGVLFIHGHTQAMDEWLVHIIGGHALGAIIAPHLFLIATPMLPTLVSLATEDELIIWVGRAGENNEEAGCGGPLSSSEILERARQQIRAQVRPRRAVSRDEMRHHIEEIKEVMEEINESELVEALEPGGLVDVTAEAHRVTANVVGPYLTYGFYGAPHEGDALSDLHAMPIISAGTVLMHPHNRETWEFIHKWGMCPKEQGGSPFVWAIHDEQEREATGNFLVATTNWPLMIQAAKMAGVVIYVGPDHQ